MTSEGCSRGARAYCCAGAARSLAKRDANEYQRISDDIERFVQDPYCPSTPNLPTFSKRSEDEDTSLPVLREGDLWDNNRTLHHLEKRGLLRTRKDVLYTLEFNTMIDTIDLVSAAGPRDYQLVAIWDQSTVVALYPNLSSEKLVYLRNIVFQLLGVHWDYIKYFIVCRMEDANRILLGDSEEMTCTPNNGTNHCSSDLAKRAGDRSIIWTLVENGVEYSGAMAFRPVSCVCEADFDKISRCALQCGNSSVSHERLD